MRTSYKNGDHGQDAASRNDGELIRLLQFTVETSADAIFWIMPDGRFFHVNKAACEELGYTRDELQALCVWDIDPRYTKDKWPGIWRETQRRGILKFETVHRTKFGKLIPVDIIVNYLKYNGAEYSCVFSRDITDRKRSEEALRESEERFRQLAEYSPIPMAIIDKYDIITYINKKTVEVFGYTLEDIPQLKYWWPMAYPDSRYREDAVKRWENGVKDAVRESKEIIPLDNMVTCKDGSVRYTEIYGVPIGDKKFVLLQDVTERKRAHAELESAKQEAELYLDLMGHDINNMHQIALGYLELASNMPPGKEQNAFINKSAEVLQRGALLIGNVRKLQKLHEGTFQTQDLDVILVIRDIQREYGGVPNKHIILNVNGREHCFVRANGLLHDVYANLVTNAIKHTGDSAEIIIDLDVIANNGSQYCLVMVEDNGPGIPDDKKAAVFNRTLKGTNRAKGMGLGLYIVKTLVDSYGGHVWVEDRISGDSTTGARFMVMLPAVRK